MALFLQDVPPFVIAPQSDRVILMFRGGVLPRGGVFPRGGVLPLGGVLATVPEASKVAESILGGVFERGGRSSTKWFVINDCDLND